MDPGFGVALFSVLRDVLGKELPLSLGKGKKQSFINGLPEAQEQIILQASILEARSVPLVEYGMSKGEDRHDTDGSLSLGEEKASGRVDVPVGVQQHLAVDGTFRSSQSVAVNQSFRVEKTIFTKGLDGHTTTHRVSSDTMIWEILGGQMNEIDVVVSFNGRVDGMHDTMRDIGGDHDCTLRCTGRFRGGAQRFRQQQPDIPGQWTFLACGQERVWPKSLPPVWLSSWPRPVSCCALLFKCWAHWTPPPPPSLPPQRVPPVSPTYRPNRKPLQPSSPPASGQNFPPLAQPLRGY